MPDRCVNFNFNSTESRDMVDNNAPFESPVNPIPPAIVLLCLIVVVVELALSGGEAGLWGGARAVGWRLTALNGYAFSPAVLDYMMQRGDFSPDLLMRFVTYPFIHGSFTNALFGAALLLALGKFVGDVFHPLATLAVFFGSAIGGALVFALFVNGTSPLYGAFPPVYGLIGAFTYILWLRLGAAGQNQLMAFRLIGFLLVLQLLFGVFFSFFGSGGVSPVWVAELGAFVVGFALSTVLAPGGWAALLRRLRQR